MSSRGHPAFFLIFVLVLAPMGAAVVVGALLLFGVRPHLVFAAGHAVMALLKGCGVSAPNSVGVVSTVAFWWLVFVTAGVVWERRPR